MKVQIVTERGDALIAPTGRTILTNLNSSPAEMRVILTAHTNDKGDW